MNTPATSEQVDFFISYNHADCYWADGIADWLKEQQYTTVLQSQDFVAGSNFVSEMNAALSSAKRVIAVISPDYFTSPFPESEWTAAFVKDPTGSKRGLILVRVRECDIPPLLKPRVYIDLVGISVAAARNRFIANIKRAVKNVRQPRALRTSKGNDIPSPPLSHSPIHQVIHGDRNIQAVNLFASPHIIKKVIGRREGSISSAECRQVQSWIDDLVDGTTGKMRQDAYGMWWTRFKSKFGLEKYEELPSSRMIEAEEWYRTQKAMQTRGLKSKVPDTWRRKRIVAIKAAMGEMNVSKQDYYPDVARRLRMKKTFASLNDLTMRDLERVYTMALRDRGT